MAQYVTLYCASCATRTPHRITPSVFDMVCTPCGSLFSPPAPLPAGGLVLSALARIKSKIFDKLSQVKDMPFVEPPYPPAL